MKSFCNRRIAWVVTAASTLWAGSAVAADGAVETVKVRAVAHFDFDRASIKPEDRDVILADVGKMKGVTWQNITTTGHTDSVGSSAYNQKLSAKRARAVKSYLVGKGLPPTMIRTDAKAADTPVSDNSSDEGRSKNRRTEIEFQGVRAVNQ
jgi:OOP family OmpA-OmpF porin